jgi:hypothetical protein
MEPRSLRAAGLALISGACCWAAPASAQAFCGFFVGRADATLFNSASQVVMVHDEGNTVLTMVNNYKGEPRSFALVVPVPVVLEKDLVRVIEMKAIDHVDAFTAPRLVEYFDPDPCNVPKGCPNCGAPMRSASSAVADKKAKSDKALGVTVEATYTVGEYDIVILSAQQSDGLETWLHDSGFNIPKGASGALAPYVRSGLKFFVAKVNLAEQAKSGFTTLRPLQFAFTDKRFMLPIRLGMLNADGPQDLIVYAITRQHRVEVANYRNPKLQSDVDVPTFVKDDFKHFYRDLFSRSVAKENGKAVFVEHAWNMGWCDPCASEPLTNGELEQLGVWWLADKRGGPGLGQQAFVTRLHARYSPETFPEDLMLKVTKDASNFQSRYILRHPFTGTGWCPAMKPYRQSVEARREKEIKNLVLLTGWDPSDVRQRMKPLPNVDEPREEGDTGWKSRMRDLFKK